MRVALFGNDGIPSFNWAQGENYTPINIDLFREKALGGILAVKKVLKFFEVPAEDIANLLAKGEFRKEYDFFILQKSVEENKTVITIEFTETV